MPASMIGLLAWFGVSLLATVPLSGGISLDDVYPPVNASDNRYKGSKGSCEFVYPSELSEARHSHVYTVLIAISSCESRVR